MSPPLTEAWCTWSSKVVSAGCKLFALASSPRAKITAAEFRCKKGMPTAVALLAAFDDSIRVTLQECWPEERQSVYSPGSVYED